MAVAVAAEKPVDMFSPLDRIGTARKGAKVPPTVRVLRQPPPLPPKPLGILPEEFVCLPLGVPSEDLTYLFIALGGQDRPYLPWEIFGDFVARVGSRAEAEPI